ncbi:hypothetical protein Hanom_Chr16g01520841 [Helianthus anomalus]
MQLRKPRARVGQFLHNLTFCFFNHYAVFFVLKWPRREKLKKKTNCRYSSLRPI